MSYITAGSRPESVTPNCLVHHTGVLCYPNRKWYCHIHSSMKVYIAAELWHSRNILQFSFSRRFLSVTVFSCSIEWPSRSTRNKNRCCQMLNGQKLIQWPHSQNKSFFFWCTFYSVCWVRRKLSMLWESDYIMFQTWMCIHFLDIDYWGICGKC